MAPKENQKSASDFDALEPRKRGCSPLLTPKKWATHKKAEDSRLFGVKIFSPLFCAPPIRSRCAAEDADNGCGLTGENVFGAAPQGRDKHE